MCAVCLTYLVTSHCRLWLPSMKVKSQLTAVCNGALSVCFFPGKFEEKEDRVPKLEQLNSLGFMCSLNLVLNKRDLIKMELLLLETFGWNLCMPTPAHFIDYYLHASVQEGDLYNGWPLSSLSKTKAFMDKYTHYFLEVSLQGGFRGGR